MTDQSPCHTCTQSGFGVCVNNQTCVCFDGHIGPACQGLATTASTPINTGAVIAGVLGGALFTLIVGLIIFFIWKRRTKRKSFKFTPSISTDTTTPSAHVVVPALYDLGSSGRESTVTSAPTVTYHLYDELP